MSEHGNIARLLVDASVGAILRDCTAQGIACGNAIMLQQPQ
jgi:hypothetical protein